MFSDYRHLNAFILKSDHMIMINGHQTINIYITLLHYYYATFVQSFNLKMSRFTNQLYFTGRVIWALIEKRKVLLCLYCFASNVHYRGEKACIIPLAHLLLNLTHVTLFSCLFIMCCRVSVVGRVERLQICVCVCV